MAHSGQGLDEAIEHDPENEAHYRDVWHYVDFFLEMKNAEALGVKFSAQCISYKESIFLGECNAKLRELRKPRV